MAFSYFNPYASYQPQQIPYPYQQPMPQMIPQPQQPQIQQQAPQSVPTLNGQMVDSFEAARSKDVDLSGNPRYYPNLNGEEIYVKQLQSDGTSATVVYKREAQQVAAPVQDNSMYQKILDEIECLKSMLTAPAPAAKGGKST